MNKFNILSINISKEKGEKKKPLNEAVLQENYGVLGDAHAGNNHRQVSLLAQEDINEVIKNGFNVNFGDFAENVTTAGIDLSSLPIGTKLFIDEAILEVTQIGKKCHTGCEIFKQVGECIMPQKGIFAKVVKSGEINIESNCYYNI